MVLVIFGSSVNGSTTEVRDIDVAYDGEWNAGAERAVREWAADRGLAADLPIDAHRVMSETAPEWSSAAGEIKIELPAPCGRQQPYAVVGDERVVIEWRTWRDFSSGVRVYGADADAFMAAMAADAFEWRISMLPPGQYAADPSGTWDKYCTGIMALRSAVRHAPAWGEICERVHGGVALELLVAGADPINWEHGAPGGRGGYADGWSRAISLWAGPNEGDLQLGDRLMTEMEVVEALGLDPSPLTALPEWLSEIMERRPLSDLGRFVWSDPALTACRRCGVEYTVSEEVVDNRGEKAVLATCECRQRWLSY